MQGGVVFIVLVAIIALAALATAAARARQRALVVAITAAPTGIVSVVAAIAVTSAAVLLKSVLHPHLLLLQPPAKLISVFPEVKRSEKRWDSTNPRKNDSTWELKAGILKILASRCT